MDIINTLSSNWELIIGGAAIVAVIIYSIYHFITLSKEQKITNLKEWLKLAVCEAEESFDGEGTGALKLRSVYDLAIEKFPWIATAISFEQFSKYVDEALNWMKDILDNDEKLANFLKSTKE